MSEIHRREGLPVLSLKIVCRTSICGLVFASKDVRTYNGNYNLFAGQLAEALGFASFHGGTSIGPYGIGHTYIYLSDRL